MGSPNSAPHQRGELCGELLQPQERGASGLTKEIHHTAGEKEGVISHVISTSSSRLQTGKEGVAVPAVIKQSWLHQTRKEGVTYHVIDAPSSHLQARKEAVPNPVIAENIHNCRATSQCRVDGHPWTSWRSGTESKCD